LADLGRGEPVYCMPNAQSHAPLRRAGFVEVGRLRLYLTLRFQLDQLKRRRGDRASIGTRGFGLDLLDPATLNWRFRTRPEVSYEIVEIAGPDWSAIVVLRTIGGGLRFASAVVGLRMATTPPELVTTTLSGALGRRSAPVLLTLSQDPPPWRSNSWLIPE